MNTVNVAIVDGKTIIETTELASDPQGQPVRIKAVSNGTYILAEAEKGAAAPNITVKRVGKDLHITLEGANPDHPQLIIEGYFETPGHLVGVAEDGTYHEYLAANGEQLQQAAFLMDGETAPQVLGADQLSGFDDLVAGFALGWSWPAILGLGALAVVGGAALAGGGGGGGGGGNDDAPQHPVPTPMLGSVNLENGGSSNDTTPTFSGIGTPGNVIIIIIDGDNVIGEVPVGSDGEWQFTVDPPLGEGEHDFTVIEKDPDGNESTPSPGFEIIIDTTAPEQAIIHDIVDNVGSQQGPIAQDVITDDNTPTVNGTAEPGTTVVIYDNGIEIGRTPVSSDGTWSFTPSPPLADGSHSLSTEVEDAAGNKSIQSPPDTFTVDTAAPVKPGTGGSGGTGGNDGIALVTDNVGTIQGPLANGASTDDSTPTLSGSGQLPDDTINVFDNGILIGTVPVNTDGTWSFTPDTPLIDGSHDLTIVTIDPAGNPSEPSDPFNVNIDTAAPVKPGTGGSGGTGGNDGIALVTDNVGTIQGALANGASTDDSTPTLSGNGQLPGDTISVFDNGILIGTVPVNTDGTWSFTPDTPLTDGSHDLTIVTTDPAGNPSEPSDPFNVNIDTAAPVKPGTGAIGLVNDDVGSILGPIANNGSTDDTSPTLSGGDQQPGYTITIIDNGSVIGTVPVNPDGTWTFTPDTPLAEGSHDLSIIATNPAGNASEPSDPHIINIDTQAPAAATATLSDNAGSIIGTIVNGDITDENAPTFTGTAEAGCTVNIYDDGVKIGSAIVNGTGNWTFTPTTALTDGAHSWHTVVEDAAGNQSPASTAIAFTVDTTAPVAAIATLSDNAGSVTGTIVNDDTTDDNAPTFTGTAEAGSTVIIYDKGIKIGSTIVNGTGNWAFTPTTALTDGAHSWHTVVEDAAGNQSPASTAIAFTVDTTAPMTATAILSDNVDPVIDTILNGGTTNDTTPSFNGTAEAGSTVIIFDKGNEIGRAIVNDSGNWTFTPTTALTAGVHSWHTVVEDAVGHQSTASTAIAFTVDTAAPVAATATLSDNVGSFVGTIVNGDTTDDNSPTFSGTAEAGSKVIIYDNGNEIGRVIVSGTGTWTFTPNTALTDGTHSWHTVVEDAAGNQSPTSTAIAFTVDTTAPVAATTTLSDDVGSVIGTIVNGDTTDDTTPTLSGSAEAGSTVIIYDNGNEIGRVIVSGSGSGNWTFTPITALTNGAHSFSTVVEDAVGHQSTASTAIAFTVDTTAPVAAIATLSDNAGSVTGTIVNDDTTDDNAPTFTGTAEAGSTVIIYDKGIKIGSTIVNGTGNWAFTPTTALTDGAHSWHTVVEDAAGNQSPASTAIAFTVDTTAPVAATAILSDNVDPVTDTILNGGTTNDTTPTFTGTAEAGSTVIIFDKGNEIGRAIVNDSGNWTFTPTTALTDGVHSWHTIVEDALGHQSTASTAIAFTVDTTAPVAATATLSDNVGSVTGTIVNGDTTDDNAPTFTGTAEAGSTVIIYDTGIKIGSAIVNATGNWTFTPNTALTDGAHSWHTVVEDAAGNQSPASTAIAFTVDTTAPVAATAALSDNVGSVTGAIVNGDTTDDTTPTLSGSAEAGSTVIIYDNGNEIGRVIVSGSGNWTFTPITALTNGAHSFSTVVEDAVGHQSTASTAIAFTVDTTIPAAQSTIISMGKDSGNASDFITNDNSAGRLIQGTLSAALGTGEKLQISVDGGVTWVDAIVTGTAWSYLDQTVHAANWKIDSRVIDQAGNSTFVSQNVTLDTTIGAPTSIKWDGKDIELGFTTTGVAVGDRVHLIIDGSVLEYTLTQADLDAGKALIPWDASVQGNSASIAAALVDSAQNISQYITSEKADVEPVVEDFNSQATRAFVTGETIVFDDFNLLVNAIATVDAGSTGINTFSVNWSDPPDTTALIMPGGSTITLTVSPGKTYNFIGFTVGDFNNTESLQAIFYDQNGNEVHRTIVTQEDAGIGFDVIREVPHGFSFSSVTLSALGTGESNAFWVDDITFGQTVYQQDTILQDAATVQAITEPASYYGASADNVFSINQVSLLDGANSSISGGLGIDTLQLTGTGQVLNLTSLGQKLDSMEVIDLTGSGNNTLNLSLADVLDQGGNSMFISDNNVQMLVKGNAGDTVNLDDLLSNGSDPGNWANSGTATVSGVVYVIYHHDTLAAELLVQQGVQTNLV